MKRTDEALEHRCSLFVGREVPCLIFFFFLRTAILVFFRLSALYKVSKQMSVGVPSFWLKGEGARGVE